MTEVFLFVQAPTRSSSEMSTDAAWSLAPSSEVSEDKEATSEPPPSPVPEVAVATAPPASKAGKRNKKHKGKGKKQAPSTHYASPTIMAGGNRAFRPVRPTGCNVKSTGKPPSLSGGYKAAAGMLA